MRTLLPLSLAALATAGLLAGCTPATYPSATFTTPSAATPPSTSTPIATPTWTGDEARINDQIQAYTAFLSKAFADPTVPTWQAANYATDVDPDYLLTAVQKGILKFRADGNKETGTGTATVQTITADSGGTYVARVCGDNTGVLVTNSTGQTVDTGPKHAAALYTMTKGVNGTWYISRIKGVGTC